MNSDLITQRIWRHSKMTGVNKLILLALAQHSDRDGFCWPGYDALGEMVGGLSGRNAMRNLAPAIEAGEVITWKQQGQHGGRGYTNIYLIVVGLNPEQIREIVQRRFDLASNEIDTVLERKGDDYIILCGLKRVSIETLLRTKDDKIITHKNGMGDKVDTVTPPELVKGDKIITRTSLDSYLIESKSSKDSLRGEAPQKLSPGPVALALLEICKQDWEYVETESSLLAPFKRTLRFLTKKGARPGEIREYPAWRKDHHWKGKKDDSAPTFKDVGEEWKQYQEWIEKGRPAPISKNGATSNGKYNQPNKPLQKTGESLDEQPVFNIYTGEIEYPDGRRVPGSMP